MNAEKLRNLKKKQKTESLARTSRGITRNQSQIINSIHSKDNKIIHVHVDNL